MDINEHFNKVGITEASTPKNGDVVQIYIDYYWAIYIRMTISLLILEEALCVTLERI